MHAQSFQHDILHLRLQQGILGHLHTFLKQHQHPNLKNNVLMIKHSYFFQCKFIQMLLNHKLLIQ